MLSPEIFSIPSNSWMDDPETWPGSCWQDSTSHETPVLSLAEALEALYLVSQLFSNTLKEILGEG